MGGLEKSKTGELGFEPRQTAPEAVVLPLHYSPIDKELRHSIKVWILHKYYLTKPEG